MEEKSDLTVPKETILTSNAKCLICASRDVIKSEKTAFTEQLKLFEQLIEQKTDDKLQIGTVGFCKTCSDSLESYKKLKVSCIRAWKIRRESTNLVPVIVTPELKLFRIEEPYKSKKESLPSIRKTPVLVKKPPISCTQETDPLKIVKLPVKYVSIKPVSSIHSGTTPSLIKNNYCYICKNVKSSLYKHLLLAHCLIGKDSQKTCSECGLVSNNEKSFFKHFEQYHNERATQRQIMIRKKPVIPLNRSKIVRIPISNPPKLRRVSPQVAIKKETAT